MAEPSFPPVATTTGRPGNHITGNDGFIGCEFQFAFFYGDILHFRREPWATDIGFQLLSCLVNNFKNVRSSVDQVNHLSSLLLRSFTFFPSCYFDILPYSLFRLCSVVKPLLAFPLPLWTITTIMLSLQIQQQCFKGNHLPEAQVVIICLKRRAIPFPLNCLCYDTFLEIKQFFSFFLITFDIYTFFKTLVGDTRPVLPGFPIFVTQ